MACPSQVDKIRDTSVLEGTPIDQVFIGSCTNGRLEDLQAAAEVLKGKKVADYVKLIVTPASRKIYLQASKMGTSKVEIYLASPKTAAACAVAGKIVTPEV